MQSYFRNGPVTSAPYPGEMQIPLEPEPIYSRQKGAQAEVIATYDAEFRAGFDRKITEWAIDFMTHSQQAGKPFYVYLPYTQVHTRRSPTRSTPARPSAGIRRSADPDRRFHRPDPRGARQAGDRAGHDRGLEL